MKHPYIPCLANQCKELYGFALKDLQKESVKQIIDKDWLSIVSVQKNKIWSSTLLHEINLIYRSQRRWIIFFLLYTKSVHLSLQVSAKQLAYEAITFYYYSLHFKANKSFGEEISAVQQSVELFKSAQTARGKPFFSDQMTKAQRNLAEVKKDNDLIYHDIIPDVNKLEPIGKISMANPLPMPKRWSQKSVG